jgi:hypothetical protein
MTHASGLTEGRLALLYNDEGFGGEKTMRARVIRELIDEIRVLRSELLQAETGQDGPQTSVTTDVSCTIGPNASA